MTLTITDDDGNTTTRSVSLYRELMDLDSVIWKFRDDTNRDTYITKTGTAWFDDLYYGNVAADSRVPFSDAKSLKAYL